MVQVYNFLYVQTFISLNPLLLIISFAFPFNTGIISFFFPSRILFKHLIQNTNPRFLFIERIYIFCSFVLQREKKMLASIQRENKVQPQTKYLEFIFILNFFFPNFSYKTKRKWNLQRNFIKLQNLFFNNKNIYEIKKKYFLKF